MNKKVLHTLEYHKIIEMLTDKASSEPGKALCRELTPMTDLAAITQAQTQTGDALSRLFKKGHTSFGSNKNIVASLKRLAIGSSLSSGEILTIAAFLENVSRVKAYGRQERDDTAADSLTEFFDALEPFSLLTAEIRRCILAEDEIADDASPALKQIRKNIAAIGNKIHSQLNAMVNGSYRTYLQDAVITMRDNRYCLPVKTEYKNQVPGMVHDQSSSGSTYFIEPIAIVNLNNELKQLYQKEKEEIEVILATISGEIEPYRDELQQNQTIMTALDFIFARASLAMEMNATCPLFRTDHILNIRKGRHPLLPADKAVPIDVHLGRDFDLLIVTGPNTGGKTVSLKTVGLFTLMGQAGLHIPALDRSELSIFEEVYADIGDEQSIEQSLSTFSSHMTSIVHILTHADQNSLCLFDELGAGTDPTEGAALAIAILSHLHGRGIRTMATTHYSELKVYALSTDFVENACCEFNVETLRPTYKLLIGIPGKSNAFAISAKLGLPAYIIDAAKEQISADDTSFEDVLADLEQSRITIEKEELEIAAHKQEIEKLRQKLREKNLKIDNAKDKILREANEQARQILQDAKDVADEAIIKIQKTGTGTSIQELEKNRDTIRSKIKDTNAKLSLKQTTDKKKSLKPGQLKKGDSVQITSMGLKGTVSTLPDQKGNMFVQCGIIRSQVHISDLVLLPETPVSHNTLHTRTQSSQMKLAKSYHISAEINLLGKTVDEAISALDKYLDDAYLAHLPSVRIVHGKGTGALRNAVQQHLKRTKYVKSYRLGEFGEGDAGVTIAVFKE